MSDPEAVEELKEALKELGKESPVRLRILVWAYAIGPLLLLGSCCYWLVK
jgi:hypothetical protein